MPPTFSLLFALFPQGLNSRARTHWKRPIPSNPDVPGTWVVPGKFIRACLCVPFQCILVALFLLSTCVSRVNGRKDTPSGKGAGVNRVTRRDQSPKMLNSWIVMQW